LQCGLSIVAFSGAVVCHGCVWPLAFPINPKFS